MAQLVNDLIFRFFQWEIMCETEDTDIDIDYEYDSQTESYHFTHDLSDPHLYSTSVIMALEAVADHTSHSLEQPLYDIINLEGINTLFKPKQDGSYRDGQVRFTINGFHVRIHGHGEIIIQPPDNGSEND